MKKRLTKCKSEDAQIEGVCGGIAVYLNVDVTFIRIAWLFLSLTFGTGLILYICCSIAMPDYPKD